jgi:hypothetical protein
MTIKQALKYKNKLVKKINDAFQKVYTYNSVVEGQTRPYDVNSSLAEYFELTSELVNLKERIHKANQPVYGQIFLLSELKSQAQKLSVLTCDEGKVKQRFSEEAEYKTAVINVVSRDNMVKNLEEQIEMLQDELDVHNATTEI